MQEVTFDRGASYRVRDLGRTFDFNPSVLKTRDKGLDFRHADHPPRVARHSLVLPPALIVPSMVLPFTRPLYSAPPAVKLI